MGEGGVTKNNPAANYFSFATQQLSSILKFNNKAVLRGSTEGRERKDCGRPQGGGGGGGGGWGCFVGVWLD